MQALRKSSVLGAIMALAYAPSEARAVFQESLRERLMRESEERFKRAASALTAENRLLEIESAQADGFKAAQALRVGGKFIGAGGHALRTGLQPGTQTYASFINAFLMGLPKLTLNSADTITAIDAPNQTQKILYIHN